MPAPDLKHVFNLLSSLFTVYQIFKAFFDIFRSRESERITERIERFGGRK
jgi:hypothetical protein